MARLQGDWKDVLQAQRAEIEQLEAMDSALNDDRITADIDKALKKTSRVGSYGLKPAVPTVPNVNGMDEDDDDDDLQYRRRPPVPSTRVTSTPNTGRRESNNVGTGEMIDSARSPLSARGGTGGGGLPMRRGVSDVELDDEHDGGAPDTAVRYQKARLKMLSKQLEDSVEMRKQLTETVNDLQKQIRVEREENKKQRKRIQLLESDAKRNSGKRVVETGGVDTIESLSAEVANLRKDVQTAERIAKQSEVCHLILNQSLLPYDVF